MGYDDKIKNKVNEGVGKVEETVGRLTGNEEMRQEGEVDKVQDAAEKAKGAFKK